MNIPPKTRASTRAAGSSVRASTVRAVLEHAACHADDVNQVAAFGCVDWFPYPVLGRGETQPRDGADTRRVPIRAGAGQ